MSEEFYRLVHSRKWNDALRLFDSVQVNCIDTRISYCFRRNRYPPALVLWCKIKRDVPDDIVSTMFDVLMATGSRELLIRNDLVGTAGRALLHYALRVARNPTMINCLFAHPDIDPNVIDGQFTTLDVALMSMHLMVPDLIQIAYNAGRYDILNYEGEIIYTRPIIRLVRQFKRRPLDIYYRQSLLLMLSMSPHAVELEFWDLCRRPYYWEVPPFESCRWSAIDELKECKDDEVKTAVEAAHIRLTKYRIERTALVRVALNNALLIPPLTVIVETYV